MAHLSTLPLEKVTFAVRKKLVKKTKSLTCNCTPSKFTYFMLIIITSVHAIPRNNYID